VDGPAGVRIAPLRKSDSLNTFYCTAFPIETLLASTWDTDLIHDVGKAMGNEVLEYGADILLAPALNIHRNPLNGRNFEYYSEDPYLSGYMTAAMVNGVESVGVGTSIKHFAANNQETNRMLLNTVVSERVLREIYLRGFEIAIKESQPWTVMSSYNKINDIYTSQSQQLLTTILRDEWGFIGLVMTDWFSGNDVIAQIKAGNDLIMPGSVAQAKLLFDAVIDGNLNESIIDRNAARILSVVLQSPSFKKYEYSDAPNLKKNAQITRKAASEGVVLLKNNDHALPIASDIKVAVFGNTSYDFISGGSGSGDVNEAYTVSLVEGLKNADIIVNERLKDTYNNYLKLAKDNRPKKRFFFELLPPIPEMEVEATLINDRAKNSDIAFITIGRNSGEMRDRKIVDDFYLTKKEQELIQKVSDAFHGEGKKVVTILNIGNVIEMASWRDKVDAVVLAWQGGQEGGNAVTDVLRGAVNPSGKLPTTFSIKYEDAPSSKNFPGIELDTAMVMGPGGFPLGKNAEVTYEEGIYVGYRYFNTFNVETAYPFGFGLSYTNFTYSDLNFSESEFNDNFDVTVNITNSGDVAGKEVVQLYISAPDGKLDKPIHELKGFAKTKLLEPGDQQQLKFTITGRDLTSFDPSQSAWVVEEGFYTIEIGASSTDIKLQKTISVKSEIIVEKCRKVLVASKKIDELVNN
jgi:beta-glucosidase